MGDYNCNLGSASMTSKPHASPQTARRGKFFYRREKEVGRVVINRVHGFSWTELLLGKKRSLSSLLGSAIVAGHESSTFWSPSSVQSLSHVQLCNPKDCSTLGFLVHHLLPVFAQTYVHRVGDVM